MRGVLRNSYRLMRWLTTLALVLIGVLAVLVLGLRYLMLPNIDQYRPVLESRLSAAVGAQVQLGQIEARWHGRYPQLSVQNVRLIDGQGHEVLVVPEVDAEFSWQSVWTLRPYFRQLHVRGLGLALRRDGQGRMWALGQHLDNGDHTETAPGVEPDSSAQAANQGLLGWLALQPLVTLDQSTLTWIDETRTRQPLVLDGVDLTIRNHGAYHQFAVRGRAALSGGGDLEIRGQLQRHPDLADAPSYGSSNGRVYVSLKGVEPAAWLPWIDWPATAAATTVSGQAWLDMDQGRIQAFTADVRAHDLDLDMAGQGRLQGGDARFLLSASASAWQTVLASGMALSAPDWAADGSDDALAYGIWMQNVRIDLPEAYHEPLVLDGMHARGRVDATRPGPRLAVDVLDMRNRDMDARGQLVWDQSGPGPGYLDAVLRFRHLRLAAVHRYMPRLTGSGLRQWLRTGLRRGEAYDTELVVRGDLRQFPFIDDDYGTDEDNGASGGTDDSSRGLLRLHGPFRDAVIDYAPASSTGTGWPALQAVNGSLDMKGNDFEIHAQQAVMQPTAGQSLHIRDVKAHIADLHGDAVLSVDGMTQGDAESYLAFMRSSPVGAMLDHVFAQSRARGQWSVPVNLHIPLSDTDETQVQAAVHMQAAALQISPAMPWLEDLTGVIRVSDAAVVLEDLTARLLDQPVQLGGGMGADQKGLTMRGQVSAAALMALGGYPEMTRINGLAGYQARLSELPSTTGARRVRLDIRSDLRGLESDLPAPLTKPAGQAWPMTLVWTSAGHDVGASLELDIQNRLSVRLKDAGSTGIFRAGAIGMGVEAVLPAQGLSVDVVSPVFDGDAWDEVARFFDRESAGQVGVMPPLRRVAVQASRARLLGQPMDELDYQAARSGDTDWKAVIRSRQTTGSIEWSEKEGRPSGTVRAVFERLTIGSAEPDDADSDNLARPVDVDEDLRIPSLNLVAEKLIVRDRIWGKLVLTAQEVQDGQIWQIDGFSLTSLAAVVEGHGLWRLRGPGRGLSVDAQADVSDLGDYLDQLGFANVLTGGAGTAQASLFWQDLPWSVERGRIGGQIDFSFESGRLNTPNSGSARLLELISLQSFKRLSSLDVNPLSTLKDGFPFDVLRGSLELEQGLLHSRDYRVIGPVGTAVLDGHMVVATGDLDLQAVVVPSLDVSGAALAAGIAINPVVGVGAFLTQWLLKAPIENAMAARYVIEGNLDEPVVRAVSRFDTE